VVFLFLVLAKYKIGCGREGLAIISQTSYKDGRHHISALETYSNHKVPEIVHYYIHAVKHKAQHSTVVLMYKTLKTQ